MMLFKRGWNCCHVKIKITAKNTCYVYLPLLVESTSPSHIRAADTHQDEVA